MNILFVTRKYPPSVGGMELFAKSIYEALSVKANVRLLKFSGRRELSVIASVYLWFRAIGILLTSKVDVIYIADGLQAPLGVVIAKIFRKKCSVVIHGLDYTWPKFYYQWVAPPAVRRADAVFCISQEVYNQVVDTKIDKTKVYHVPLAINDDIFGKVSRSDARRLLNIEEDRPLLLSVGRLVKRKGIAWFIGSVMPELVKQFPGVLLLIIGVGDELENIRLAVKQTGLEVNIRLDGKVSEDKRLAAYNGADVFVMPNIAVAGDMEGFGLVLLEAASSEVPVVASAIEGINDAVISGKNGILVPSKDSKAFTLEIAKFLSGPKEARKFGAKARQYTLDNYNWENVADKYLSVYEGLIK